MLAGKSGADPAVEAVTTPRNVTRWFATWLESLLADFGVWMNEIGQIPPMKLIVCGPFIGPFWLLRTPFTVSTSGVVDGTRFVDVVSVTVLLGPSYTALVIVSNVLSE